jgi:ligand-binding SRPBCC domain-containing protein
MPRIETAIVISAPIERVFDLARSIDVHKESQSAHRERAIGGRTSGLIENGEVVTWEALHFGVRQRLTSRIVAMTRPTHFRDSMVAGAFKRIDHDHFFESLPDGRTRMKDIFDYVAPLGPIGRLADWLFLEKYMRGLLEARNDVIRRLAESSAYEPWSAPAAPVRNVGHFFSYAAFWILPILGVVSAYQLAFCCWMCAYHTDQPALSEWQHRLYIRLATTLAVGIAWISVGIRIHMNRKG